MKVVTTNGAVFISDVGKTYAEQMATAANKKAEKLGLKVRYEVKS